MRRRPQGFTLIELLVVLFIVILGFAAVGINISSGSRGAQMKSSVRNLVSALRYARGQALISRKEVTVAIDLSNNTYQISNRSQEYDFPENMEVTMVVAQDELENDEIGKIRFFPDGSSSGGRVTLEWDDLKKVIDVNWLTGQAGLTEDAQQ